MWKRLLTFLLSGAMVLSLAACGQQNQNDEQPQIRQDNEQPQAADTQALPSQTASVGEKTTEPDVVQTSGGLVQGTDEVGGDLFRIETVEDYPLDHDPLVDQAAEEQDADVRPELASHVENFEQYEYVFLGYPNWWGDIPMPVYSFLEEYDFGAKTIIPFITHGGSGASRTADTISELQPGALLMGNELVLSRNDVAESEETVVEWAQGLGVNNEDKLLEGGNGSTVLTAVADARNSQTLYLWEEGNVPAVTEYTQNNGNYGMRTMFPTSLTVYRRMPVRTA